MRARLFGNLLYQRPRFLPSDARVHYWQVLGHWPITERAVVRHFDHLPATCSAYMVHPAPLCHLHLYGLAAHDVVIVQAGRHLLFFFKLELMAAVWASPYGCCQDFTALRAFLGRRLPALPCYLWRYHVGDGAMAPDVSGKIQDQAVVGVRLWPEPSPCHLHI